KRMLAFSSIAHAGFILIAVIAMDNQSTSAIMFYLLSYAIATVGAFAAITLVRQTDAEGNILGEANQIDAWAGLGRK
ncbi:proton-conducting transporter membrane subunit, partial [Aerococcus sp. UMB8623]